MTLIPKVLSLQPNVNSGAVFGIGAGGRVIFIGVALLAVGAILTVFWRSRGASRWFGAALAMVLAGAIGNLYDRIVHGVVRDMLFLFPDVNLPFGWHWPGGSREVYPWIFNIADAALDVGVLLIVVQLIARDVRRHRAEREQSRKAARVIRR